MPEPTKDELRKEIAAILKDANLEETAAKKVRLQLEDNLKCDLSQRKKEVDDLVMEYVNAQDESGEDDEEEDQEEEKSESEEDSEEEEAPKKKGKRGAPAKRPAPASKKKKGSDSEEEDSEEEASDDDYKPNKGPKGGAKKGPGRKKKGGSDSDSDEDWKKNKPAKGAKKKGAAKSTGYTRPYNLSPELAAICGAESLPRHEVVKKVWAIIKERNLYDPKNKQYAICDSELQKVIGVKRFRTFGMLKYLKPHFLN